MKRKSDQRGSNRRQALPSLDGQRNTASPRSAPSPNCSPHSPQTFPRRLLLAVTGLSPQVVTETLYALTQKVSPAFVPTEIHLLTTAEGAERARLTLLSDDP